VQRLVLELDASQFAKVTGDRAVEKIESLEVLHFVKQDLDEVALICDVKLKGQAKLEDVFDEPGSELRVLNTDKDGKHTVFMRSKPQDFDPAWDVISDGVSMLSPFRIREGRLTVSLLGSPGQIKAILSMARSAGLRYRAQVFSDTKLLPNSPMAALTERQRQVITAAFRSGYYDMPRKTDSKRLAEMLNIGSSDLIKHRRKAERRLLKELVT